MCSHSRPLILCLTWCPWANSRYHHENLTLPYKGILNSSHEAAQFLFEIVVPACYRKHPGHLTMVSVMWVSHQKRSMGFALVHPVYSKTKLIDGCTRLNK